MNSRLAKELRERLGWNMAFKLVTYTRSTLWVVPFLSIVLVMIVGPLLKLIDSWLGWRFTGLGLAGAQALCDTVITLSLSFMVFTFGSLLVAIQVASGQLTPRVIATTLLRDNVVRYSVGLFVFTLVFTVMVLDRLEQQLYGLVVFVVAGLGIGCIATFLFLIDYAARLLRPVSILTRVGESGLHGIKDVYPEPAADVARPHVPAVPPERSEPDGSPCQRIRNCARRGARHVGRPGAAETDGIIECLPHAGDFIASGEPIFKLYGGAFGHRRRRRCRRRSPSARSAPWNRIRCSRFASWSTSRSRPCRRRSTIRPRRYLPSTNSLPAARRWQAAASPGMA